MDISIPNQKGVPSTSTKYCLPSKGKILTGVTARVDSTQIGHFENLAKYNRYYVKGKNAHLLEEIPMSFKLCMVSRHTLHTLPLGVPAKKEIYKMQHSKHGALTTRPHHP